MQCHQLLILCSNYSITIFLHIYTSGVLYHKARSTSSSVKHLRRVFFLTSSIARQKYHNNLLPLVRVGLNLVGFARGYDTDGCFDRFHSWKVFFPLLISNLCRKDMKHFVIEKPKVQMEDLLQQACHEMRTTPAVCLRSYDWFWLETVDFRHLLAMSIQGKRQLL